MLLASPTNLVAIARSVAQVWRQVGLEKEAREIAHTFAHRAHQDLASIGGEAQGLIGARIERQALRFAAIRGHHIDVGIAVIGAGISDGLPIR